MIRRRTPAGILLTLLLVLGAPLGAAPGGVTPRGQALVQRVAAEGEERAIERLLSSDEDPWIVAEELLLLGRRELALRLAIAVRSDDDGALEAYLRGAPAPSADLATRVGRAAERLGEGQPREALAALGDPPEPTLTVTEVRYLEQRARVLHVLDREDEAGKTLGRLATRAAAIRWRRAEISAQLAQLERIDVDREHERARRILASLLGLDRDARDLGRSAAWCARLGVLEARHGRPRLARTWLLEAESLFEVLSRSPGLTREQMEGRASMMTALAGVHRTLGNAAAGIKAAFRADDMAKALGPRLRMAAARQLAAGLHALSRLEEAERHLREAEEVARVEDPSAHVRLLGDLARLRLEQGDTKEAGELYQRVLSAMDEGQDRRTKYVARLHVAGAWIDRPPQDRNPADLQRALVDLLDALQDLEAAPADFEARSEIAANTLAYAGRALNLLERHAEAIPLLQRAIAEPYAREVPSLAHYAERELAHALRRTGRAREALVLTAGALAALRERVAKLPAFYALSLLSAPTVEDLVSEHVAAALAQGSPRGLIDALEATRGIVFLAEVRRRRLQGARASAGASLNTVAALASELGQVAQAYWEARSRGGLAALRRARRALWEHRLRLRHAEERAQLAEAPVDAAPPTPSGEPLRFREPPALREDEAMLYGALAGEEYMAVLAWRDRVKAVPLGRRLELEATLKEARDGWLDPVAKEPARALEKLVATVLPEPLRERLAPRAADVPRPRHVYVSAAGVLAKLPWPVLIAEVCGVAGADASAVPTVSLISSQKVLAHVRTWNPAAADGPMLAVGDPDYTTGGPGRTRMVFLGGALPRLPASAEEVRAVADPDRGDLALLGSDANEFLLRQCLFDAPYPFDALHFACHGLLYGKTPWMSALALHANPEDDGLVTVDEVEHWQFRGGPRLIVLSACESGLGAPVSGEGEEGLVRAFLLAGARHVVASFWKVPDTASRDLMIAFHRYRREQRLPPPLALMRAQADVRASAAHRADRPFDWAGWAVWGPRD